MSGAVQSNGAVVVIGRGILGALTALRLAHARRKVVVIGGPATQSNLAFGWISGFRFDNPLHHLLSRISRQAWVALLDQHLGREGYIEGGCLKYALDRSGIERLNREMELVASVGLPTRWLGPEQIAELLPGLKSPDVKAFLQPDDGVIDAAWATRTALQRASALGAEVLRGTVESFTRNTDGTVRGVVLDDGSVIPCQKVLLAAGCKGNDELGAELGIALPAQQVLGIQLRTRPLHRRLFPKLAMIKRFCDETSTSAGISFGQFPDRSFVINEKFVEGVDPEARLMRWLKVLSETWPDLCSAEVAQIASTIRWVPRDGDLVCGFAPSPNSNVYVLGTNSDGVTMSALLSDVAATEICGGPTGFWDRYSPGRFASQQQQDRVESIHNDKLRAKL
eukprot:TRINITY_DN45969_c0_g1_i1.p1 TRINITY_DN45969_c0_g1~~TRINITY_DN45969_c0_g1_i1.p1  ORF type:complete len:394 (-),score=43.80 TRINITY_DN45969_c0_g1_i1:282-1463(-)